MNEIPHYRRPLFLCQTMKYSKVIQRMPASLLIISLLLFLIPLRKSHVEKEGDQEENEGRSEYSKINVGGPGERRGIGGGGGGGGLESGREMEEGNGKGGDGGEEEEKNKDEGLRRRRQKVVVLWTSWRSGSSFMGQVLARASPAAFYSYEPLHMYGVRVLDQDSPDLRSALALLKDLMLCRLEDHADQVSYTSRLDFYFEHNVFLRNLCRRNDGRFSCRNATYVSEVCRAAELHVVKVLRLSLKWLRPLLEDSELDIQVVYLARDPRAVLSSRVKEAWCTRSCQSPEAICSLLEADLQEAALLLKEYPTRFKFINYDQVCVDAQASLKDVMAFLNLPVTRQQEVLLPSRRIGHHSAETYSRADLWRRGTSFTQIVVPVQNSCRLALEKLGLRTFVSENDLLDLRVPTLAGSSGL